MAVIVTESLQGLINDKSCADEATNGSSCQRLVLFYQALKLEVDSTFATQILNI
ncbi:MAG: hypothetical protein GVY05_12595 [Bacteroidetes bacterium]|nr:hypothetical protein [Bacteroidota bacterium]